MIIHANLSNRFVNFIATFSFPRKSFAGSQRHGRKFRNPSSINRNKFCRPRSPHNRHFACQPIVWLPAQKRRRKESSHQRRFLRDGSMLIAKALQNTTRRYVNATERRHFPRKISSFRLLLLLLMNVHEIRHVWMAYCCAWVDLELFAVFRKFLKYLSPLIC